MSEITEKDTTTNGDFDLEKHIEQECIKGSYDRLLPVIQKIAEYALKNPNTGNVNGYVQLEKLSLELAQLALNYLAVQKGIAIEPPRPATREELEEISKEILANKRD